MKKLCLCCGYLTLQSEIHDLCPVCWWQDDPGNWSDRDAVWGANGISLREAQQNFQAYGACERVFLSEVRPPKKNEMMGNRQFIFNQIIVSKPYLAKSYGVIRIGVFGSYARNEQLKTSDIDILIEFDRAIGLEFMDIQYYLEDKLGVSVDLARMNTIKPQMRDKILNEIIFL